MSLTSTADSADSANSVPSNSSSPYNSQNETIVPSIQFKSYIPNINSPEDIEDEIGLPLNYQFMFDKRTSPWEMKDWYNEDLNAFTIQTENIDRLYHIVADDEDPNFRSWELCCRINYKGEKYFAEMYANTNSTGFDDQGGGHICLTKLADFFMNNMVTNSQNPDRIYRALLEDGYDVQEIARLFENVCKEQCDKSAGRAATKGNIGICQGTMQWLTTVFHRENPHIKNRRSFNKSERNTTTNIPLFFKVLGLISLIGVGPSPLFTGLSPSNLTTSLQNENIRLLRIFDDVIHPTLHDVFTQLIWKVKKDNETLRDFTSRQIAPPSSTDYRKAFDKGQREKIERDPLCVSFDISLYSKSYEHTARYNTTLDSNPILRERLRKNLKDLTDIRNNGTHNLLRMSKTEVHNCIRRLGLLMSNFLDLTGDIFGCKSTTDNQKISVLTYINQIKTSQHRDYDNSFIRNCSILISGIVIAVVSNKIVGALRKS